jgi:hypothetical protein
MDTDSLIVELKTNDLYKDEIFKRPKYDLSNYPSPLANNKNKAQLGFFKDEYSGIPIIEFCGLAPKIYSIKAATDEIIRSKCKGSKEKYKHQQFKDSLVNNERVRSNFNILRGINHKIYSMSVCKWGLNPYFDKRYFNDSYETYAYGNYRIKNLI